MIIVEKNYTRPVCTVVPMVPQKTILTGSFVDGTNQDFEEPGTYDDGKGWS